MADRRPPKLLLTSTRTSPHSPPNQMIDLFDGANNEALLIEDCDGNPNPHHWLGDGYCDDGTDVDDGGEHACIILPLL